MPVRCRIRVECCANVNFRGAHAAVIAAPASALKSGGRKAEP